MGADRWVAGLALLSGLVAALSSPPAAAAEGAAVQRIGGDLFTMGCPVTVHDKVGGDLFAAGCSIDVDATVAGDAVALGGKVRLGVDVEQSLYAAGGQVHLAGKVARNARLAGGQVDLGPKSEVAGNVSAAGNQVRLQGTVRGHVQAAGGKVLIDGPVGGDVLATSGEVELGPGARIAGKLRYRSNEALRQDPAAQVTGGIEVLQPTWGEADRRAASAPQAAQRGERHDRHDRSGVWAAVAPWWTLGLALFAAVLLWALPRYTAAVAQVVRERPGASLAVGFVLLVCVPVGALVAVLTVIGIPLALAVVALYLALLPVAYVMAAIGVGDWALHKWRPAQGERLGWRIGAAALALVVLALLGALPWLGGLVAFAVLLAGLGALALQAWRFSPAGPTGAGASTGTA